jgi:hypothetical protein
VKWGLIILPCAFLAGRKYEPSINEYPAFIVSHSITWLMSSGINSSSLVFELLGVDLQLYCTRQRYLPNVTILLIYSVSRILSVACEQHVQIQEGGKDKSCATTVYRARSRISASGQYAVYSTGVATRVAAESNGGVGAEGLYHGGTVWEGVKEWYCADGKVLTFSDF